MKIKNVKFKGLTTIEFLLGLAILIIISSAIYIILFVLMPNKYEKEITKMDNISKVIKSLYRNESSFHGVSVNGLLSFNEISSYIERDALNVPFIVSPWDKPIELGTYSFSRHQDSFSFQYTFIPDKDCYQFQELLKTVEIKRFYVNGKQISSDSDNFCNQPLNIIRVIY